MGTGANNTTGHQSLVNGLAFQDFTVTGGLYMNLGGGNDLVQLGFSDGSSGPSFSGININVAAPIPLVQASVIGGTTTTVFNGPDADQVIVWAATSRGAMSINTGNDHDWVFVGAANISGNLSINSGAGADEIDVKGAAIGGSLDIQTYSSLSENDSDTVYFDAQANLLDQSLTRTTTVNGSANIRTGGGDDHLYSTDPNVADLNLFWLGLKAGDLSIDMGGGNDTAFLRNLRVGNNFSLNTGAGADTLMVSQHAIYGEFGVPAAVEGHTFIQMYSSASETDVDTATFTNVGFNNGFTLLTGGGADIVQLNNVSCSSSLYGIAIDTGAGNDRVTLNKVTAADNFFANLGAGDDYLSLTDLYVTKDTSILGGDGYDSLWKYGTFPTSLLMQTGWELLNGRLNITTMGGAKV
jgi:hypothetical protein